MSAWQKFFRNKNGNVAIWQKPNLPLIVWFIARVAQWPLKGGAAHLAWLVGTAAILLWALLEVVSGASYVRRALGVIVLALTIMSFIK